MKFDDVVGFGRVDGVMRADITAVTVVLVRDPDAACSRVGTTVDLRPLAVPAWDVPDGEHSRNASERPPDPG